MGLGRANWIVAAMLVGLLGGVLSGCGNASPRSAVIRATPAVGLFDQPRSIVVSHLAAGEVVTVSAVSAWSGNVWSASATYRADAAGVVDLARTGPRNGSYRGVSAMGLFWSQHLVRLGSVSASPEVTTLTVSGGGLRLASATITQILIGPGVTVHRETLAKDGFVGEYYSPPGGARRPAVVVWGGSEGGLPVTSGWEALFASHGIPALAVAYFDEPGLPCSLNDIPLEYFVKAIKWLRAQPQVDPSRVWMLSGSRGTEAELLVAAHWPGLVHGFVAVAPSSIVYGSIRGRCLPRGRVAWTLHGQPVPSAFTVLGAATQNVDGSISERSAFETTLGGPITRAAQIPIARFKGPALLISGGDDQLWPSSTYSDQIMKELRSDSAPHVHLNYPAAGHTVLDTPSAPPSIEVQLHGTLLNLGGTPAANAAAHASDWPATIRFITTK